MRRLRVRIEVGLRLPLFEDVERALVGEVVSDLMKKTVVVRLMRSVRHPKYGKYVHRTSKYYAHDEDEAAKVGDVVEIEQTRPLSRLKRWRLVRAMPKPASVDAMP